MKKILTLGVTLLALAGLTACQSDDATLESNGRTVTLRVQAKYPGYNVEGPETRTTMAVESGKLKCRWEAGDQIYVTNTSGVKVGYLTLEEGAGEEYGYFSGTLKGLPEGTNDYMFAYLGSDLNAQTKTGGTFSIDLSNQDNTITSFPKYDVLITKNTITVTDNEAVCSDLSFIRQMAYAHFKLNLPTGVTRGTEPVTISGTNISFRRDYDLSVPNVVDNTNTSVITVNGRGNDLYVALAPMQNPSKPTLSVTIGGVEYSATLDAKTLTQGTYYCGSQTSDPGIAVAMTVDKSVDHTKNPLRKWAKGNLVYNPATGTSYVSTDEYAGGSLYQWGRSHGFSDYTEPYTWDASLNSYKYGGYGLSSFSAAMGLQYMNGQYYYKTGSLYRNTNPLKNDTNRDWFFIAKPTQATSYFNSSVYNELVGYMSTADYLVNVNADYWPSTFSGGGNTWSERAKAMNEKDVCPAGYRLPTDEDYTEIFPAGTQLSSESTFKTTTTTSDVRELADGSKYAISWSWESHGQQQVLVIKALMVPADFTKSQISASTWSDANVEVRRFPATGGIKAYYHQHKYKNGYIVTLDFMQPMPFGKWNVYLRKRPVVNISYENISDAGKNYQGGYWMSDQKKIATFRLDDGSRFGSENGTSYVGRILTPAQDAHAIRCIIINP